MLNNGPDAQPAPESRRWFLACKTSELESGAREVHAQVACEVHETHDVHETHEVRIEPEHLEQREHYVIAVFKTASGYYAVDGMCAHQGGPLAKGAQDGTCITCPWHGWQYDVTNGKNMLTGRQMLTTYSVEVRGDEVWVALPT
jgi:nitrite reductase (NADH) small subunit